MGLTQHPFGVDERAGPHRPGAGARQRGPPQCGAHAHPGAFRRAGGRGDGRLRHRLARRDPGDRRERRRAVGALWLPGAPHPGPVGRRDAGGRGAWRAGRAVVEQRELPGRPPRPGPGGAAPRQGEGAGAPGHRGDDADARGPGRGGGAAARGDPVRAGGRRHRDRRRAAHRLQPADPARQRGRGALGVADLHGRRQACAPRDRPPGGLPRRPGDPRRDRPRGAAVRRHPASPDDRRPGAVGRPAPVRRLGVPHP